MDTRKENVIVDLTTEFSLKVIAFHYEIKKTGIYPMASQLFRSATSIGANVREAQNAESKNDFIHKMKIAAKEADETDYWLTLCKRSPVLPDPGTLQGDMLVIHKLLSRIISTSKKNLGRHKTAN